MSEPDPSSAAAPPARRWRRPSIAALIVLFLLPLALRLRPVAHGMPRNYVPDTHMVRQALGMARDQDLAPPVGRYSTYPNLVPYMLLPLYGAAFAVGLARGDWSGPAEFGDAVSDDPSTVHLLARVLVALFGALTPWVVFRTARVCGLSRGAWVAAWLVGVGVLHTHFSVQERPWVPMAFFLALATWPAAVYVDRPRLRTLCASGAAAGLSFACHQAGLLALAVPGLAWLFAALRFSGPDLRRRLGHGVACVALFGLLALVLGQPHRLVHGSTPLEATIGGDAGDISIGGQSHQFGWRWASAAHLSAALFGHEPGLLLLALLGLLPALRVRAARPATVFALLWAAYFVPHQNDHVRYLLPLVVLLPLPAGFAAERALARGHLPAVGVVLLLALGLAQDVRLGHVLSRPDTRALAEERVPALLPPGARLAVDRYGPAFDLDREALALLAELRAARGQELSTRERRRAERAAAGPIGGLDALFVQELFAFDERAGAVTVREELRGDAPPAGGDAPEALRAALTDRGVTHLLLVDRAPAEPAGCLLRALVAGRTPLVVVDPAAEDDGCDEARLPMDMDFPLTALWQVERPGPWLALYDLR